MNWARTSEWLGRLWGGPWQQLELSRLKRAAPSWKLPYHIGIILDGNRRFARERQLATMVEGHALGADKLFQVLDWSFDLGIAMVTIWIFSLDNFHRDREEVEGLLTLIEKETRRFITHPKIHHRRINVRYLGRIEMLPASLRAAIAEMERVTMDYSSFYLNVAIAYGGREEIGDAVQRFLADKHQQGTTVEEILAHYHGDDWASYLYTAGMPDPDLIIRTSGEVRLSGFLLWQSAYSEYYFCDSFWPAFQQLDLLRALQSYDRRQRRFGR